MPIILYQVPFSICQERATELCLRISVTLLKCKIQTTADQIYTINRSKEATKANQGITRWTQKHLILPTPFKANFSAQAPTQPSQKKLHPKPNPHQECTATSTRRPLSTSNSRTTRHSTKTAASSKAPWPPQNRTTTSIDSPTSSGSTSPPQATQLAPQACPSCHSRSTLATMPRVRGPRCIRLRARARVIIKTVTAQVLEWARVRSKGSWKGSRSSLKNTKRRGSYIGMRSSSWRFKIGSSKKISIVWCKAWVRCKTILTIRRVSSN